MNNAINAFTTSAVDIYTNFFGTQSERKMLVAFKIIIKSNYHTFISYFCSWTPHKKNSIYYNRLFLYYGSYSYEILICFHVDHNSWKLSSYHIHTHTYIYYQIFKKNQIYFHLQNDYLNNFYSNLYYNTCKEMNDTMH